MEKPILTTSLSFHSIAYLPHLESDKGELFVYEKRKMNRRRDRHDVIAQMLKVAMGGKIKTHIMYEVKLNYPQLEECLELLVEKKLLKNNTIRRKKRIIKVYETTERGMEFLDHLEIVNKLWAH